MTWSDYHPIPGKDWADPSLVPQRKLRIALVAVDFDDQPFVITLPKKLDPFGNPQVDPVKREQVPQFYADFYNKPGPINHGRTINGYWMEQSRGSHSLEVVQRIGYDSFTPDNGVLINKIRDRADSSAGYGCFNWVIDAHPEDINMLDFKRPDGTPVMRTVADYRQLNDALFHAGLNSGSQYEWEDTPNRLHFYIIDLSKDKSGILSYTVGVRSLDGSGPQVRGVSVSPSKTQNATPSSCVFTVTNTGKAATTDATLHPQDASSYLNFDIYRLSVSIEGQGWSAQLQNALAAVPFGGSITVPVYINRLQGGAASAKVTLKAQSESDPGKVATGVMQVK